MTDTETQIAADLLNSCDHGALGTLDPEDRPFVSFVALAVHEGHPVLLLSRLAQHCRHLARRGEASLLLGPVPTGDDPLTQARVTLTGTVVKFGHPGARTAFLTRHPAASQYAGFGDFSIYRLEAEKMHLVAGFGRIASLDPAAVRAILQKE